MIVYREAKTLARDLGFSIQTLYAVSNSLPRHYHSAELPKRDGTVRHLSVPDPLLKTIQRRIADRLLPLLPVSPMPPPTAAAQARCATPLPTRENL